MGQLNTREELLATIQSLREDLDQVVAEVDEERMLEPETFGEWSFKDLIAHLTGWRLTTATRLEAGLRGGEPVYPWPSQLDESDDLDVGNVDEINRWFFETNRDKPFAVILRESNETFERVERAIAAMPEDDLLMPGRFAWVSWTGEGLGPAVVRGTRNHYRHEHEPAISVWLIQR